MNIRLGIVGPEDSVRRISAFAQDIDHIQVLPLPYQRTEETEQIIQAHRDHVDQWFFSGQAPYYFAREKALIREEEAYYPHLYGSSLLGTLLQAVYDKGECLHRVSLDTIQEAEIHAVQTDMQIQPLTFYTYPYTGYLPAEDIIRFHTEKYKAGKIDVALTCIQEVYQALQRSGIPCYRVVPSRLVIQQVLDMLKERGQTTWYKKAQIAIIGVEVLFSSPSEMEERFYSYKMKHQELDLKQLLLDYAEIVQGSFIQVGDGLHFIYTTRGELDDHLEDYPPYHFLEEAHVQSKLHVRMGIGYGLTALQAEQNVRTALQYGRQYDTPVVVSVNEDKEVTEYLQEDLVSYQQRGLGSRWEKKVKDAHIGPSVVSKIETFARRYGQDTITAHELSQWLKGTERNARRILREMEKVGLVKVTGEEQPGHRGRPRKVYQLLID
ncbi:hypothetical protein [Caldalkalibacillus salinus]|uniref:hypothetical protein n=1 Tax=Caldalkalibacillus salinus TaxID=2803787 RepID=UPI00192498B9|nr:hypothetical protein [Caldalkalibacillus salinus]